MSGATADKRILSVFDSLMRRESRNTPAVRSRVMQKARGIVNGELLSTGAADRIDRIYVPGQGEFLSTESKEAGKYLFRKPILPLGSFRHQITGKLLEYPEEKLAAIKTESNRFVQLGNTCPFPSEHTDEPEKNLGWWGQKQAYDICSAPCPKDPKKMVPWIWGTVEVGETVHLSLKEQRIKYVSPGIRYGWKDANGNEFGPHFFHVAATGSPVIPNQQGFERVELSTMGTRKVFAINKYAFEGEKDMSIKKIALALGLPEGASEDEVLSAISAPSKPEKDPAVEELSSTVKTLQAANKSLADAVKTERKARHDEYLSTVKGKAVAFGTPLDEAQVKKIGDLLDKDFAGAEDAAKTLADTYLSVCELKSKKSTDARKVPHTEGKVTTGPQSDAEKKTAKQNELLSTKMQLEGQGYEVDIVNDEIKVLKAPGEKDAE